MSVKTLPGQNGSSYSTIPSLSGMLWLLEAEVRGSGGGALSVGVEHRVQGKSHNRQGCSAPGEPDLQVLYVQEVGFPVEEMRKSLKSFNPGSAIRCFGCQQHPVAKCEGRFGG